MELPARPEEARWASMTLIEQMANIGSETGRTYKWLSKSKPQMAMGAYIRALDLIDLTLKTGRRGTDGRGALLEELCRCRDIFTGSFLSSDLETLRWVERYFAQFAKALSLNTKILLP